ncbi:MAG: Rne/Rng family ribonuclease [Clostridia bacterium]|nr:Rne/Rng family ribonuclease [Clostridia bacterium]
MEKEILIQADEDDTRVAVLEEGRLVEIYFGKYRGLVGNIFKGKVANVLPGIQAAFIDIGLEKNAFLYAGDVVSGTENAGKNKNGPGNIEHLLKPGQEIMVQVTKEPLDKKGARLTTQISIPGRFAVLMPYLDYVGVSRKIKDEEERDRLRAAATELKPDGMGIIVRTVAEGISPEELNEDIRYLTGLWEEILERNERERAPAVLYRERDLVERTVRDLFNDKVVRLQINDRKIYDRVCGLLGDNEFQLKNRIFLFEDEDLFEKYNIPHQVMRALRHKVWLKCGGFIIIEHMEALTAIDVNTGKYIGSRDLEETIFKTNLDAAVEIARQLRLRNIGGIIIIDFIDMAKEEHRQRVLEVLERELEKDKTHTKIMGLTRLGLVEITRKKEYRPLEGVLLQKCPHCDGKGKILSREALSLSAKKEIINRLKRQEAPILVVKVNPYIAAVLGNEGKGWIKETEKKTGKKIIIKAEKNLHEEDIIMEELWETERGKGN